MTSWNNDSNYETEQVVAVAAAAYAINLMDEESSIHDQTKTSVGLEPSLRRDKSRKEDETFPISKPRILSKQFTGEDSRKGSESVESKVTITDVPDEKAIRRAPSFKKPVTFADHIGSSSSTRPISPPKPDLLSSQPEIAAAKPDLPTIKPERASAKPDLPTTRPVSTAPKPDYFPKKPGTAAARPEQPPSVTPVAPVMEAKRQTGARPGIGQSEAEAWEKAEMAKIKEKYVKLNSTILDWEEKKKKKARSKLEKAEQSELEKKKARALTKFRNEMEYIKEVADGARAQAQSRQRDDELKVKEKANRIRETGKVPRTCFCC
ncbi:hypothetical protein CCACVL1_06512 [Corchorus capsularis]|uniref:Remorin C-terminal domain-containing protein n=1 Tax=Corchorus capsularis TaxID=210143 RepID=A0A1R3JF48_COCAP|nr:hypothetical protein CCACVL1_06512 [Corchorus capsularis]